MGRYKGLRAKDILRQAADEARFKAEKEKKDKEDEEKKRGGDAIVATDQAKKKREDSSRLTNIFDLVTAKLDEITQEYIKKARDADYQKAVDARGEYERSNPPKHLAGYGLGKQAATQSATTKKANKLLAKNKRRTAERDAKVLKGSKFEAAMKGFKAADDAVKRDYPEMYKKKGKSDT